MASCIICNLCDRPGSFAHAMEVIKVPCHVRKFQNDFFTMWRCTNCGSLHSKEDPDLVLYYKHYPLQKHKLDFHAKIGYANRLRLLKRRGIGKKDRILDFGCGAGLFVDYLQDKGYQNVFGYDAFVDRFCGQGVLETQYDVIVSHDVIEHVDEPRDHIRTLFNLLNGHGLLVIGTPNAAHISIASTGRFPVELSQPYHRHILTEGALKQLAAELGMIVEHTYRRFYFDSLYPSVNTRFMWSYVKARGGFIDACFEPPQIGAVLRSPELLFYAFFGYFFPPEGNMLLSLRKTNNSSIAAPSKKEEFPKMQVM